MCFLLLCARQIFGIGLNPCLMLPQHEVMFERSCDLLKRGASPTRKVSDVLGDVYGLDHFGYFLYIG